MRYHNRKEKEKRKKRRIIKVKTKIKKEGDSTAPSIPSETCPKLAVPAGKNAVLLQISARVIRLLKLLQKCVKCFVEAEGGRAILVGEQSSVSVKQ